MIEQTMIFALGFLVAGLAALAFTPAFWQRALRLTRRQLEMQIPLSVQEILAERDQLRAEFAVERCRLDQRAAELTDRHAAQLAAMGRQAIRIGGLESELQARARTVEEADQERQEALTQLASTEAELGTLHKALYDAEGLLERRQNEFLEYIRLQESMRLLAEMRFAALAASDARVASLELRLGDMTRNLAEAEQKLVQKELQLRSVSDVLSVVRHEREGVENKLAKLQEKFGFEIDRGVQVGAELAALREKHDSDLAQLRSLMVKMNVSDAALEDALRREKDVQAQRDLVTARARKAEQELSDQIAYLRSEHAAAQGALAFVRQRCEELETLLAAERLAVAERQANAAAQAAETAALRQSISDVGAAVLMLSRPHGSSHGNGAAHTNGHAATGGYGAGDDGQETGAAAPAETVVEPAGWSPPAIPLLAADAGSDPSHEANHESSHEPAAP